MHPLLFLPKPCPVRLPRDTRLGGARGSSLIATDGVGLHQIKGGKLEVLQPGDVVFCPPGVVHWHGSAPESSFAHIAINPEDNHEVTWYDFPADKYPAS